jgi:hypothetical protein
LGQIRIALAGGAGPIGDIAGAFVRAGFGILEGADLEAAFIESHHGLAFKTGKLAKSGIDIALLVQELRQSGLVVVWSEEEDAKVVEEAVRRLRRSTTD